jgi:5-methylcytosine-specific restriction enzyme A
MAEWPYNTARWQRVRRRQLLREPLCRACQVEGVINAASEVDHIERVSVGGAVFDPANMQSLCKQHHSVKRVRASTLTCCVGATLTDRLKTKMS